MAGNAIGSIFIELGVNAGAFVEGLSKATYKAKQACKEIGEGFSGLGKNVQGLLGHFGEMGNVIGEVLGEAGETIAKFSGHLAGMTGGAAAAAIGITALGAVVVATGAALGKMAMEGAEVVESLDNMSQKTGMSIRDLQVLKAAGGTVGLSIDAISMGFRRFDQALAGTGRTSGAAGVILKQLGVTATDNKEAIYQLADAFSKMENGPRKTADAIALFGRTGMQMIPFLNKGAEGMRQMENLVDQYGPKIGKEAVEANERYEVSQQKLSMAWDSALVAAEQSFLPSISKGIDALADFTKSTADVIEHLKWMATAAEVTAKVIATGFGHGYVTDLRTKITSYIDDPAAPNTQKKSQDSAHSLLGSMQADRTAQAKQYAEVAQKSGETELAYNYRNLALMQQEEKVKELMAGQQWEAAEAESAKLVPLREAAQLEDKVNALRRDPIKLAPSADPLKEIIRAQDDQLAKQSALSQETLRTKDAIAIYTAEQNKRIEMDKKVADLTNEIAKQQGEFSRAHKDPARQSEITQRIAELTRFRAELAKATPDIVAKEGAIALAGQIGTATSGLQDQAAQMESQADAVKQVSAAYMAGYTAIRDAEVDKAVQKQQLAVDQATLAYQKFVAEHGELAAVLSPEKDALDDASTSLDRMRAATGAMIDLKLSDKIQRDTDQLNAEADAWRILADAAGQGMAAQVEAEEAAARARASGNRGASQQEIDLAGKAARQHALEGISDTARQTAAQYNLVQSYQDQISKLELIKKMYSDNAEVTLLANAQEHDALIQMNKDWDTAALKVGDFNQQMAAMLNELKLDGEDFWSKFLEDGLGALQSLEGGLAKFAVTGKGNFKQIGSQFAENFAKTGISALVSKGASSILDNTGLGGLIPGFGAAKLDGSSEANAMWVQIAKGTGIAGGLNLPSLPLGSAGPQLGGIASAVGGSGGPLGLLGTIGSFFGLPFLAGGGDVTPGQAYVVGEDHPELFVPDSPGRIVPDGSSMSGGNTVNNFHFHGVTDADSFKRSKTQISQQISNSVGKSNGRR